MSQGRINQTTINILRGNLAEQDTDAVALGVDTDWTPAGPASGAILSGAGDDVREEINILSPAEPGSIRSITGGQLPCEQIYLVALVTETELDGPGNWIEDTYRRLFNSIRKDSHTDVALPPLGLGDFDWSIDRTSTRGLRTIKGAADQYPFDTINFVVYDAVEYNSVENFADTVIGGEQPEPDAEQQFRDYY